MHPPTAYLPPAELTFEQETPISQTFGDVYFSKLGGIAETEHVFLAANGLPGRWQTAGERFCVAELGFGTGLNFLVTWRQFCATAPAGTVLHYHAVERQPLTQAQLAQALALQPALAAEAEMLLTHYPLRLPGPHAIALPRCQLHLWWGDVAEWLAALAGAMPGRIDAWYLDGFAPAKNPDMWGEPIYRAMATLSAPGAHFATFTAASAVRRGLLAAGFAVEKVRGFGRKREMLRGHYGV